MTINRAQRGQATHRYEEHQHRMKEDAAICFDHVPRLGQHTSIEPREEISATAKQNTLLHVTAEPENMTDKLTAFAAQRRRQIGEGDGSWGYYNISTGVLEPAGTPRGRPVLVPSLPTSLGTSPPGKQLTVIN